MNSSDMHSSNDGCAAAVVGILEEGFQLYAQKVMAKAETRFGFCLP